MTEEAKVEAVARAICAELYGDPDFDYGMNKPRWRTCVPAARAALRALQSGAAGEVGK